MKNVSIERITTGYTRAFEPYVVIHWRSAEQGVGKYKLICKDGVWGGYSDGMDDEDKGFLRMLLEAFASEVDVKS